tara:strand:- start:3508 stop:5805 length:2298 start_codon:yes stop_codon:yes gene_type:complete
MYDRFPFLSSLLISALLIVPIQAQDEKKEGLPLPKAAEKNEERINAKDLPLLEATELMSIEAKWLGQVLQRAHYSKVSLKKLDRRGFLETYLGRLDSQRMYFLEKDFNRFIEKFTPTIVTYVEEGNLHPAFEIYSAYRTNSLARMDWVLDRLKEDFSFDGKESFAPDREEAAWPKNKQETDELWVLRLKYELLGEILPLISADQETENGEKASLTTPEKLKEHLEEARTRLVRRYERWRKNIVNFEAADVQELYLTTLTQMFDPHSTFLNIDAVEEFNVSMKNSFVGIGAVLNDIDGYCTINKLIAGGPAEESKQLEPGDVIMKVAQGDEEFVDVVDTKLKTIVKLIKGPKATIVRLMIKPVKNPAERKIVALKRDEIKLTANLASASVHEVPDGESTTTVGVIELPAFYGDTRREKPAKATDDVAELIEKLKKLGVDGLVLDLRRNGGGFLSEAINLTGLFISRGPVVQVRGTDGRIIKRFDYNRKIAWDGPLVLLCSRYSASASEIVAGALQHHGRALIVGDKETHGKGTVQSMIEMNSPYLRSLKGKKRCAAKITIQKYYLPSGKSTQNIGVTADIKMNSINEFLPIGESDLPHALESDSIPAVLSRMGPEDFVIREETTAFLDRLSQKRQKELPEFDHLEKNIAWYKGKREQKEFSLNLKEREEQKHKDDEFSDKMKEAMKKLAESAYSSTEIKLDVVTELERRSKDVRTEEEGAEEEEEKAPTQIDIRLRESLRIMADWLRYRENASGAVSEEPAPVKES